MASIDDILAKKKEQVVQIKAQSDLEPTLVRKKIERSGKDRPWRENLDKRISANDFLQIIEDEHIKRDIDRSTFGLQPPSPDVPVEITNKPATELKPKLSQSEAKVESLISQRSNKLEPKLSQSEASIAFLSTNLSQEKNKVEPQPEPLYKPKLSQSEAKVEPINTYSSLVGLQKNALNYVFNSCRQRGSKSSGPITISNLCDSLKSPKSAVRKAIQRLEQKQCIERTLFKDGRGGWSEYLIPDAIYSALLYDETRAKVESNISQTRAKVDTQLEPQLEPRSPIVVVKELNTKNTTNTEEPCFVIPNELSGKVSRRQLSEFVTLGKISESDLQLSLDAFAYDLKNKLVSLKHSSNPIGLLIGSIKNNGSYNSAKYVEALKSELKPFIQEQREATAEKTIQKTSKEWDSFQKFKLETPEDYKLLESKVAHFGFSGVMLEEFTFLEFKKVILKIEEEPINPLRPPMSVSP